jgi:hypothetical protein
MAVLITLSNAALSIDVGDHGIASKIYSLSDTTENLNTAYILKLSWTYYDAASVITYPGAGVLTDSGTNFAEVTITGETDGYGNTVDIVQTVTLDANTIDVETKTTLTAKGTGRTLCGVLPIDHYQVILEGVGREAGEKITTVGNSLPTATLDVYPDDINCEYFRDGEHQMWLAIHQTGRYMAFLGVGYQYIRGEGLAAGGEGPARVRVALENRIIGFNVVGDIRYCFHRIKVVDETKTAAELRTLLYAAHVDYTANLPNPVATPSTILGTDRGIARAVMNVYSVGAYDPYLDSIYLRDHYIETGDDIFLWGPQRMYYANPQNNSSLIRCLGYDPAWLALNLLRPKVGTIVLRTWPTHPFFINNPTKSVYRADEKVMNGYYQQPDGYPPLHLMAQPLHADMAEYWEDAEELAKYYDFDILSLEEMYYVDISYGPDDETHFLAWLLTNRGETLAEFPRVTKPGWYWADAAEDGKIVKFWDERIIAWRNYCTSIYYAKWRDLLHTYHKKLAVEVRWSTIPGVHREELEATLEAGVTQDVGWKSVAYWNAYDYNLVAEGIADLLVLWWYWDIWTTDLGGGDYETTNDPEDFTDDYVQFLNTEAHLGGRYHLHLGPRYKGENGSPIPDWWKYSLDKFETSLSLYRKNRAFQASCDLGPMPGTHSIIVSLDDISQTDEIVIRGDSATDALQYWKDVVITKVGDAPGDSDYTEDVDFRFDDTRLEWLGVDEPAEGAAYYVTYTAHDYIETYGVFALPDDDMKDYFNAWFRLSGTTEIT